MKRPLTHRKPNNLEGGQAMIMSTVFFIVISTAVMLGLGVMISSSQKLIAQSTLIKKTFYLAEAGAEDAAYDLIHGQSIGTPPVLDGSSPSIDLSQNGNVATVISTATLSGLTRKVEVVLTVSTTSAQITSWKETK